MLPLILMMLAIGQHQTKAGAVAEEAAKVLCGFWFEWRPQVDLTMIPKEYNMICVAFIEDDSIPTFRPRFYSDEYFIEGIKELKNQGRDVLVSIGGAAGHIAIKQADKSAFKQELMGVLEKYGFNGVDIDLEGESVRAADNQTVIPEVLREIKDHYRAQGREFVITMAPEFIDLRGEEAPYRPYVDDLEGYYNLIFPQYYNQGADGIWSHRLGKYLSQNDDEVKADFLYELTHAIVTGTEDFIKISHEKFAMGLPASPQAAKNGYVKNPEDVAWALDRLAREGNPIRGLMTWSINHDSANGYEFARRYAPMLFSSHTNPQSKGASGGNTQST